MASEKIVSIDVGKGLDSGISPSAEPTSGEIWSTGSNLWFRELSLEQSLGNQRILQLTGRPSTALAQAFNSPNRSLYYETNGIIYQMNGTGFPNVFAPPQPIAGVDGSGDIWLEPWGTWLIISDNINQLKLWQGGIGVAPIDIGVGQFVRAKIIKKIAQFAVAYNTDVLPNGFHWCDVSDPTDWTPDVTNAARNLVIRDLDSEIVAVADLGAAHAVYSRDTMLLVQYVGPDAGWLGTPSQALRGIGAVSRYSVVSVGRFNYGLSRAGIFTTDGVTQNYMDRPALDTFLKEEVNWNLASQIWGYYDEKLSVVKWVVPLLSSSSYYSAAVPRITITLDPRTRSVTKEAVLSSNKPFSFLSGTPYGGMQREVFEYPITILNDGLYYDSVEKTLAGSYSLTSHLFDGGDQTFYKVWDYATFGGTISSEAEVAFGFTDNPTVASISWLPWQALTPRVPIYGGPKESIFAAMKLRGSGTFKLTSFRLYGEKGGFVN